MAGRNRNLNYIERKIRELKLFNQAEGAEKFRYLPKEVYVVTAIIAAGTIHYIVNKNNDHVESVILETPESASIVAGTNLEDKEIKAILDEIEKETPETNLSDKAKAHTPKNFLGRDPEIQRLLFAEPSAIAKFKKDNADYNLDYTAKQYHYIYTIINELPIRPEELEDAYKAFDEFISDLKANEVTAEGLKVEYNIGSIDALIVNKKSDFAAYAKIYNQFKENYETEFVKNTNIKLKVITLGCMEQAYIASPELTTLMENSKVYVEERLELGDSYERIMTDLEYYIAKVQDLDLGEDCGKPEEIEARLIETIGKDALKLHTKKVEITDEEMTQTIIAIFGENVEITKEKLEDAKEVAKNFMLYTIIDKAFEDAGVKFASDGQEGEEKYARDTVQAKYNSFVEEIANLFPTKSRIALLEAARTIYDETTRIDDENSHRQGDIVSADDIEDLLDAYTSSKTLFTWLIPIIQNGNITYVPMNIDGSLALDGSKPEITLDLSSNIPEEFLEEERDTAKYYEKNTPTANTHNVLQRVVAVSKDQIEKLIEEIKKVNAEAEPLEKYSVLSAEQYDDASKKVREGKINLELAKDLLIQKTPTSAAEYDKQMKLWEIIQDEKEVQREKNQLATENKFFNQLNYTTAKGLREQQNKEAMLAASTYTKNML